MGKTKEALKEAEQFLSSYPDSQEGYQLLSNIYFNAKEYEKAVQFAKEALNLDPMNFEILVILALAYYELGMYEEHEEINELLISQYPDNHYTYAMHAQFLFHDKNEYEKARFYIEKAVELEPDDPFSLVVYSEILAVFLRIDYQERVQTERLPKMLIMPCSREWPLLRRIEEEIMHKP